MKIDKLIQEIAKIYLGNYELHSNYSPDWMLNPNTHRKLSVHLFIPRLRMCINFQGLGSLMYNMASLNNVKKRLCKENNTKFIQIKKKEDIYYIIRRIFIPKSKLKCIPPQIESMIHYSIKDYTKYCSSKKFARIKKTILNKNKLHIATETQNKEREDNRRRMELKKQMYCA